MSDRQLVSRTWYALAGDDRLWEPHCRADPICAKMIIHDMVESGGWRRFYATRYCVWHESMFPASPVLFLPLFTTPWFSLLVVLACGKAEGAGQYGCHDVSSRLRVKLLALCLSMAYCSLRLHADCIPVAWVQSLSCKDGSSRAKP